METLQWKPQILRRDTSGQSGMALSRPQTHMSICLLGKSASSASVNSRSVSGWRSAVVVRAKIETSEGLAPATPAVAVNTGLEYFKKGNVSATSKMNDLLQ